MIKVPINPNILKWAMRRNKIGPEALALSLDEPIEKINSYINGSEHPPLGMLEKISYSKLKIPLALFFFPEPPSLPDSVAKFRRLPESEQRKISVGILAAIRLAQSFQDSLEALIEQPENDFNEIKSLSSFEASRIAAKAREKIGVSIKEQLRFRSAENFLRFLRHKLEPWGVFTFKGSLEDRAISGFCLDAREFPIIYINNSNSFTRQVFTLAHELGHLCFGLSGVTDIDESYISEMDNHNKKLEVKCNQFASAFLLPESENAAIIRLFSKLNIGGVEEAAHIYSISREFVLRRLLQLGAVSSEVYESWAAKWNKDYLRARREKDGGDYYITQLAYLGETYARAAFRRFHAGQLTHSDLATCLNIRTSKVLNLEAYLR